MFRKTIILIALSLAFLGTWGCSKGTAPSHEEGTISSPTADATRAPSTTSPDLPPPPADEATTGGDSGGDSGPPSVTPPPSSPTTPTDSDGDGIFDADDHCPDTPSGTTVDVTGCPVVATPTETPPTPRTPGGGRGLDPSILVDRGGPGLPPGGDIHLAPGVSFSCRDYAFVQIDNPEGPNIYLSRHCGEPVNITHNDVSSASTYSTYTDLSFSPDGNKLLFSKQTLDRGRVTSTWAQELDLTSPSARPVYLIYLSRFRPRLIQYSPDGTQVAFISNYTDRAASNDTLWICPVRTDTCRALASASSGNQLGNLFWWTDDRLIYSKTLGFTDAELDVYDLTDHEEHPLLNSLYNGTLPNPSATFRGTKGLDVLRDTWAHGAKMAYISRHPSGRDFYSIYQCDLQEFERRPDGHRYACTNSAVVSTAENNYYDPSWSLDAEWIYFLSDAGVGATMPGSTPIYEIHRIHPDGSGEESLTNNGLAKFIVAVRP